VESSSKHLLPLTYGDVAVIETTFVNSVSAKIIFNYKIFNPKGQVACTGKTIQVFVDDKGTLALNFPDFFEEWKRKNGLLKE
jgi:acyl-CoA thioester hydrolase